ncbi:transcription factor bHLH120-like [Euphorbia lathyris]|uniref:transcription factor bHLH120-like n=1 Tax=Euphorbia lathyris TaxID=212925 RepID=UPI0033139B56
MFPFQENNEYISSYISSDLHQDLLQDTQIILGQPPHDLFQPTNFTNFNEEPQLRPNTYPISNNDLCSDDKRKIVRKELERQRRKQMSTLHASLRSLLPPDSIKGKRSMSDHLNEAAKYIEELQNNVKKLRMKRDKLKNLGDLSSVDEQRKCSNSSVIVSSHVFGVEIVISCGCKEENVLLSRVVEAVVEEGFDVVSSISTKTDTRLYHTIQCQGSHINCVDVAALQQKLNDEIL